MDHISEMQPVVLLQELYREREKYIESDRQYMSAIVNRLVEIGVYPAFGFNGRYPALEMVESYGVDWHQFSTPHYCSECGSDLRDWETGVPGKREIYVKPDPIKNDFDPYFMCPDCGADITNSIAVGKHKLRDE